MDSKDKEILQILQNNANISAEELGERIHLGAMAAWRRLRKLEEQGVVRKRVALLDATKVGRPVIAYVLLRSRQHGKAWFTELAKAVQTMPEVQEFYRMSGEIDFMLRVSLKDLDDYRRFYNDLTSRVDLLDVSTSFAFETLKHTTAVHID